MNTMAKIKDLRNTKKNAQLSLHKVSVALCLCLELKKCTVTLNFWLYLKSLLNTSIVPDPLLHSRNIWVLLASAALHEATASD